MWEYNQMHLQRVTKLQFAVNNQGQYIFSQCLLQQEKVISTL